MQNKLLLGSQSAMRKMLLTNARIPFTIIGHTADEEAVDKTLPFEQLLLAIASAKMNHITIGADEKGPVFVLTADTMIRGEDGNVYGKPKDKEDAIKSIKALRSFGTVGTAFCLTKQQLIGGKWQIVQRIDEVVSAQYELELPDSWIERYMEAEPHYLSIAGGLSIEAFGQQFLKSVYGSYATILGLPMVELRQALEQIGFFD